MTTALILHLASPFGPNFRLTSHVGVDISEDGTLVYYYCHSNNNCRRLKVCSKTQDELCKNR